MHRASRTSCSTTTCASPAGRAPWWNESSGAEPRRPGGHAAVRWAPFTGGVAVPVLTDRPDRPTARLTPRSSPWSPRRVVLLVAGAVLLLRLTYLAGPPSP